MWTDTGSPACSTCCTSAPSVSRPGCGPSSTSSPSSRIAARRRRGAGNRRDDGGGPADRDTEADSGLQAVPQVAEQERGRHPGEEEADRERRYPPVDERDREREQPVRRRSGERETTADKGRR